ncbi:MAG: nucleotidyltransferase domain-containing protein [Chloroflexota bacterium]
MDGMDGVRALDDDDQAFEHWYGPWDPLTPVAVGALLADVAIPWWIVGGWAIDAFTGRPRDHHDIDVGFFRADLGAMLEHLAPAVCVWSNASGTLRPLISPEDLLEDCRQLWVRRDGSSPWVLDFAMTPHDGTTWISPRDESVRIPLDEAVFTAPDGLHYLRPEIVLSFKARAHRPQDEADFEGVLPLLDQAQRRWLHDAIAREHPEDRWLALLG